MPYVNHVQIESVKDIAPLKWGTISSHLREVNCLSNGSKDIRQKDKDLT